jgi:integrase
VPFFGDYPLSKITGFDIERYKHQRQKEPVSLRPRGKAVVRASDKITNAKPSTINRELAVLSHLFNKAVEWGWIDRRPAKINRFSEGQGRITYLTVEQVSRIVECAKADANAQIYPFIVIGLETAMRKSEILSIRKEHIDLQRRVIYIPKAKAGAREQPITEHLVEFLTAYAGALQAGNPWLFPSPGAKTGHTMVVRKAFRRVVSAAETGSGSDPPTHAAAHGHHALGSGGVDLPTVKRISGHKTLAMVERYAHQNGAHIQAAMDKLQARLKLAS